jgi:hypothetical protein
VAVRTDGNEPFLRQKVIHFTAELSLHIALKIQTLQNFSIKKMKYKNFTETEARLLSNALAQTGPLTPDTSLLSMADPAKPHHSLAFVSWYQSRHRQNLISFFPPHTNDGLVQSTVTFIG